MASSLDPQGPSFEPVVLSDEEYIDRLRELPPSAKLIAKVLEIEGQATHTQLVEASLLPDRTVRYALERLQNAGIVDATFSPMNARKRRYTLCR